MRYRPERGVTATPMDDGGLVLLSERSGKLYRCNLTGAAMWTALIRHDGQPDAAAATVAEQFGTTPARARADLDVWLDEMQRAGLMGVDQ